MIRINLLGISAPAQIAKPVGPPPTASRMALIFVGTLLVAFVVVGVLWQVWTNDLKRLQKQYDDAKREEARLAAIQAENLRYLAQIKDLETRQKTTQTLLNSRVGPVELMTALGNTVNRTTDLYLMTVGPAAGGRLAVKGLSNSVESIARFIAALKGSGAFDDVQLQRYFQDDVGARLSFKFDLDCVFRSSAVATTTAPAEKPAATPRKAAKRAGM